MKKVVPGDYVLAVLILALSVGSLRLVTPASLASPKTAVISMDGRVVAAADLGRNQVISRMAPGLDMDVEVKNGTIRVLRTNCPNKLCQKAGAISRPGQTIVCVPNKVIVTIESREPAEYEAESY